MELEPCPRCGGKGEYIRPVIVGAWRGWKVRCADCKIKSVLRNTRELAAEAWNRGDLEDLYGKNSDL